MFECKARGWDQKGGGAKLESLNTTHIPRPPTHTASDAVARKPDEKISSRSISGTRRDSIQVLSSSTNFPGCEYRYQKRHPSSSSTEKTEKLSFAESLEAARTEARSKAIKNISTQAAILKAQQAFKSELVSPARESLPPPPCPFQTKP